MAYVLGIAGSPRRHGNSEQLLDACLAGVQEHGVEGRKLVAAEQGIQPCRGCNACSLTGECVIRDPIHQVYEAIDGASAIVVATPVFFATVPGVLKVLYDRLQPYWARRHVLKQPAPARRPGALLLVRGGGDPFGWECAARTTRSVFGVLALRYEHEYVAPEVDSPSDLGRHPDALARAHEIGGELARSATT